MRLDERRSRIGITYHHPAAFWFGVASVTAGVVLHLPMFLGSRGVGYRLVGESVDGPMFAGMALILIGLAATLYGLFPRLSDVSRGYVARFRVKALDDAPIRPAHIG